MFFDRKNVEEFWLREIVQDGKESENKLRLDFLNKVQVLSIARILLYSALIGILIYVLVITFSNSFGLCSTEKACDNLRSDFNMLFLACTNIISLVAGHYLKKQ